MGVTGRGEFGTLSLAECKGERGSEGILTCSCTSRSS